MRKIITKKNTEDIEPLRNLLRQIDQGAPKVDVSGLNGAARPFLVSLLFARLENPLLIVCPEEKGEFSIRGNIIDCWDNAPVESFFGTIKREHIFHNRYLNRAQARQSIFVYIEQFYNRKRIHSALGYRTPSEMEQFKLAA